MSRCHDRNKGNFVSQLLLAFSASIVSEKFFSRLSVSMVTTVTKGTLSGRDPVIIKHGNVVERKVDNNEKVSKTFSDVNTTFRFVAFSEPFSVVFGLFHVNAYARPKRNDLKTFLRTKRSHVNAASDSGFPTTVKQGSLSNVSVEWVRIWH